MKKLFLIPFLAVMAMVMSCSSDDDNNMPELYSELFKGKLFVNNVLVGENVGCSFNVVADVASVTLPANSMIGGQEITLPNLGCTKDGKNYIFSGKNVVCFIGGEPQQDFLFLSVEGSLVNGVFEVEAKTELETIKFTTALLAPVMPVEEKSYSGELKVGDFAKEVTIDVRHNRAENSVDLVINNAKFAANMPLELDITLKGIPCSGNGDITFSAKDVMPYMNTETEPAAAYMFATVEGAVEGAKLSFAAKMADGLAPYIAGKEFLFEGVEVAE